MKVDLVLFVSLTDAVQIICYKMLMEYQKLPSFPLDNQALHRLTHTIGLNHQQLAFDLIY